MLVITGDAVEKEAAFTVSEIESMTDGHFSGKYTMRTLVEPHHNTYHGIRFDYLFEKAGVKEGAKSVKIICSDGVGMEFRLAELTSKEYVNEIDASRLKAILAFAIEDKPLVPDRTSDGYDDKAGNNGGPLRLVIGQETKGDHNSPKFLQNVVKIEVSAEEAGVQFADIGKSYSWAEKAIYDLADKGVIAGTGGGKFEPERQVSRAEFSKMIVLALKIPVQDGFSGTFGDVREKDWFAPFVEAAEGNGLIEGIGGGNFDPAGMINRNQIAVLAVRAMGKQVEAAGMKVSDETYKDSDKIPGWAVGSVAYCAEKGMFENIAEGSFDGNTPIKRAEAAAIISGRVNE
jgi:DMSO/TMAO reductase YedYZ molybdopterin-dependent catalytic subunit